jgi:hypothetical protein
MERRHPGADGAAALFNAALGTFPYAGQKETYVARAVFDAPIARLSSVGKQT